MQVIGEYELLEKIAEGGMGAVYKARRRDGADLVAVKVLPPHLARNPVLLKRFEKEYNATRLLDHPNIVRALDFGHHGDSPYLVMEFVEGESLGEQIERDGPLPEEDAIKLITQVAQGLHKAHKEGLIHRDVKPDNILITRGGVAKLSDLGLVKEVDNDVHLTRTGRGLGTPHFMAPEQFRNAKYVDARSDIYALAATLYMMVTGELPFKALGPLEAWSQKSENKLKPAREVKPALSERLDWAIRRAMRADPAQRPGSCREFIEDLTGRSTKPLLPMATTGQEVWYLRFTDADGVSHTVKETLISIRRSLKEGTLGDLNSIRAARNHWGPYEPLRKLPEFRDLVLAAAIPPPKPAPPQPAPATPPAPAKAAAAPPAPLPAPRTPPVMGMAPPRPARPPQAPAPQDPPRPFPLAGDRAGLPSLPSPGTPHLPSLGSKAAPPAPHFDLTQPAPSFDWGRAVLILLMALVAGAAGFFFLPYFFR